MTDGGFSAADVVNNDDTQLHCANANSIYPDSPTMVVLDSIVPGQIIEFECIFTIDALIGVLPVMDTTLTLTAPADWEISGSPSLQLDGGSPGAGTDTPFSAGPVTFSSLTVGGAGSMSATFGVRLRAPMRPPAKRH